jgi:putative peptide zinc metalloprotease protein
MAVTAPEQPTRERRFRRTRSDVPARSRELPPRLAEGLELMGEYEGSGFKEAPYIARRADGQTLQLTRLLHLVAEAADGTRDYDAMARVVAAELGRGVSADNVRFLVERKLRPLGVLAAADGSSPALERRPDQLLALKFRTALVPEGVSRALTTVFQPLFATPLVLVLATAFLAAAGWLFFVHGVGQGVRSLLYDPALLLALFGGVVLATAFHEIGHASALRYGGGRPGVMGAGIYIIWPAFYTDVTDAYRLGKAARLRTDLGGIFFNAIVAIAVVGLYLATDWEWVLLLAVAQTFAITQQLLPFLRLDGYYIISDLTGVPDMLTRIGPVLRSMIPGREPDKKVTELKPWARRVVTGYILTLIPVLTVLFAVMIVHAPRAFATGYDSFGVQVDRIDAALGKGSIAATLAGVLQLLMLVLPLAGIVLTTLRFGRRGMGGAWRATDDRPAGRAALLAGTVAAIGLAAYTWWPNGDYRPIQPGERGTLASGVRSLGDIPSGRPALTPERERQLGGAPSERDVRSGRAERPATTGDDRRRDTGERQTTRRDEQSTGDSQGRSRERSGDGGTAAGSTPDTSTTPSALSQDPATGATPPGQSAPAPAVGATPSDPAAPAPAPAPAPAENPDAAPAPQEPTTTSAQPAEPTSTTPSATSTTPQDPTTTTETPPR